MNHLTLSDDGMWLIIRSDDGHKATLRSARPGGFTTADLDNALTHQFNTTMEHGQVTHVRKFLVGGDKAIYIGLGTGPPTWWWPRFDISKTDSTGSRRLALVVGWLRAMVAVTLKKEKPHD